MFIFQSLNIQYEVGLTAHNSLLTDPHSELGERRKLRNCMNDNITVHKAMVLQAYILARTPTFSLNVLQSMNATNVHLVSYFLTQIFLLYN
jgi:hypothetical protein